MYLNLVYSNSRHTESKALAISQKAIEIVLCFLRAVLIADKIIKTQSVVDLCLDSIFLFDVKTI